MKALLIFLVVLGHILSRIGDSTGTTTLYKIIFSFHVPALLFLSGYLAKFDPKRVLGKLFPLYLLFQLLQIGERFLIHWIDTGTVSKPSLDFFTPQWTLWYLLALMIYQLLIPVFDTDNRKRQLGFLLLSLALGFAIGFTPGVDNLLAISRVFVFLPFFLLGYYEKKNGFLRALSAGTHRIVAHVVSAGAGFAVILYFCLHHNSIYARYLWGTDVFRDVQSMIWRPLSWGIAFLWICILLIWVPRCRLGYVSTIGRRSMSIYLLHPLVILVLMQTPLTAGIGRNLPALTAIAAILTVLLSWKGWEQGLGKVRIPTKRNDFSRQSGPGGDL